MLINVKVIPNAGRDEVLKEQDRLKVYLSAPAESGRANKALIELLSDYFNKSKSDISIVRGATSRNKVVKVGGEG